MAAGGGGCRGLVVVQRRRLVVQRVVVAQVVAGVMMQRRVVMGRSGGRWVMLEQHLSSSGVRARLPLSSLVARCCCSDRRERVNESRAEREHWLRQQRSRPPSLAARASRRRRRRRSQAHRHRDRDRSCRASRDGDGPDKIKVTLYSGLIISAPSSPSSPSSLAETTTTTIASRARIRAALLSRFRSANKIDALH